MINTTTESKFGIEEETAFLRNATELSLFLLCRSLVNQLRELEAALEHGDLASDIFSDKARAVLAQLNKTVKATERFDIVMPVTDYGQFSPFFWRWFNWWEDYITGLTLAQLRDMAKQAQERVQTVDGYRPENHWVSYRHTAAFTLVLS